MAEPAGSGIDELIWDCRRPGILAESMRFAERNVHHVRADHAAGAQWWKQGFSRAYSAEGFTLVHAAAMGAREGDWRGAEIRDRQAIDMDGRNRYGLLMQISGNRIMSQLGHSCSLQPGDSTFFSTSEPYELSCAGPSDTSEIIALYIPSEFVGQCIVNPRTLCLRPTKGSLDALAIETVRNFASKAWDYSSAEFYQSARIIAELVLAARDGSTMSMETRSSGQAAIVFMVKEIIHRRMTELDLTLQDIAAEAGYSLGYLHQLFANEGITLAAYLKAERLRAARSMLQGGLAKGMTITEVSLSCGFHDSSHFSRCFKEAFSMTPREAMYR